jgi:hypothetical protein
MGRNQLNSVRTRLPGLPLVVVPVLAMSSVAACPWGARVWLRIRPGSACSRDVWVHI